MQNQVDMHEVLISSDPGFPIYGRRTNPVELIFTRFALPERGIAPIE